MGSMRKRPPKTLARGRPPMAKTSLGMSRKASRTLINQHHQLEKQLRQASANSDKAKQAALEEQLAKLGGLDRYQRASLQGQSHDRGGDTSKVLLEWLPVAELKKLDMRFRLLEVGALSTQNACSKSGIFDVVHIDLNSQEKGIQQQDFMERPMPQDEGEKFDIISLSLVLNFVPEAAERGQMLGRTLSFLHQQTKSLSTDEQLFPSLFLVLPRSCVDNSRYFTNGRLQELMLLFGYAKIRAKATQKLVYSLWRRGHSTLTAGLEFPKKEVNPGRTRNNFVITLGGVDK